MRCFWRTLRVKSFSDFCNSLNQWKRVGKMVEIRFTHVEHVETNFL